VIIGAFLFKPFCVTPIEVTPLDILGVSRALVDLECKLIKFIILFILLQAATSGLFKW
jgi:hypothetical protein